ncbi:hypothetical protein Bca101_005091 [Brassica carinata]
MRRMQPNHYHEVKEANDTSNKNCDIRLPEDSKQWPPNPRYVGDMKYMLEYHEIDFDSVMEIIKQTSDFVARPILTLDDPTDTDLDIIVKISDHNLDAFRRIDLDVYIIELREN